MVDTADYIKFTILKWDKRIVNLERHEPSSFIRAMLANQGAFMVKEKMDFEFKLTREPKPKPPEESLDNDEEDDDDNKERKIQ